MFFTFGSVTPLIFYISTFAGCLYLANLAQTYQQEKMYQALNYIPISGYLLAFVGYGMLGQSGWVGLAIWGPALLALCLLLPKVNKFAAKILPIQANNHVHLTALCLSSIILIEMFSTMAKGLTKVNQSAQQLDYIAALKQLWTQDLLLVALSFIGVGFLTRRSFTSACERLGIKRINLLDILIGIGFGLVLAVLSTGMEQLAQYTQFLIDPTTDQLTEKRLGPLFDTVIGALSLAIGAALGEEILFRGAMQPRFGLFYTSLLFAFTHTNYGFSISTIILVIGGLYLGWVRFRFNTSMAMIVHAAYNLAIVLFEKLFPS